jgi:Tfp pilus assembly protein PilV
MMRIKKKPSYNIFYGSLKNSSGLSVLEILIAFFIAAIIMVPIVQSYAIQHKKVTDSAITNSALDLAQSKMEEFKNIKDINSTTGNYSVDYPMYSFKVTDTSTGRNLISLPLVSGNTYSIYIQIYYCDNAGSTPRLIVELAGEVVKG